MAAANAFVARWNALTFRSGKRLSDRQDKMNNNMISINRMNQVPASQALSNLLRLIDEITVTHEPVLITGESANAVLISEEDWRSIQETLYLLSISGMRESILQGMNTSVEDCVESIAFRSIDS